MHPRQPWPVRWLMIDERIGDALWPALRALPPGSGVVFRHHATPPAERRRLLRRVERIAAARRLVVLVAGGRRASHGGPRPVSWPAHNRREAIAGARAGATVLFVSPVFPTRSHPGGVTLGPMQAARIGSRLPIKPRPFALSLSKGCSSSQGRAGLRQAQLELGVEFARHRPTIIALGGMTERRWRRIARLGFDGWAAIDAWVSRADQKRKIVPT